MSLAMSNVAAGRAASSAAVCICCSFSGVSNHELTVSAMIVGSPLYVPNPFSSTYGTFPASWPGRYDDSMQGRPQMEASAMVPGPALVTMASLARMYSSMLYTNPFTSTLTPSPHSSAASSFCASWLFPHTTTIWNAGPSVELASTLAASALSLRPTARACSTMPPIPSPPPTMRTVGTDWTRPSSVRSSDLLFFPPPSLSSLLLP
mmetsp:Transcript_22143/g.52438  ORF Transcript_22143/g.52438 Transcript_22143/m.52438 type:complete len:206 (-) Transcript_22143:1280-1897(-)